MQTPDGMMLNGIAVMCGGMPGLAAYLKPMLGAFAAKIGGHMVSHVTIYM